MAELCLYYAELRSGAIDPPQTPQISEKVRECAGRVHAHPRLHEPKVVCFKGRIPGCANRCTNLALKASLDSTMSIPQRPTQVAITGLKHRHRGYIYSDAWGRCIVRLCAKWVRMTRRKHKPMPACAK